MRWTPIIILILLSHNVTAGGGGGGGGAGGGDDIDEVLTKAQDTLDYYQGKDIELKFSLNELMGECNQVKLQNADVIEYGRCTGNFFTPAIPNPLNVFTEIEILNRAFNQITYEEIASNPLGVVRSIIEVGVNTPLILIAIIFNVIKYLVIFAIKFIMVYLVYISLGFQTLLFYADKNSNGLNNEQKIQATIFTLIIGSIAVLSFGGSIV